jgi:hypothetical protein
VCANVQAQKEGEQEAARLQAEAAAAEASDREEALRSAARKLRKERQAGTEAKHVEL